jgi:hypothetical protein
VRYDFILEIYSCGREEVMGIKYEGVKALFPDN